MRNTGIEPVISFESEFKLGAVTSWLIALAP